MKLEAIVDVNFRSGFAKLISGDIPMVTLFKLEDIHERVTSELAKYEKVRQTSLKKYAVLKEDGTFEVDDDQNVKFKTPEDAIQYFKEYNELVAAEIEIGQIKESELGNPGKTGVSMNLAEYKAVKASLYSSASPLKLAEAQQS